MKNNRTATISRSRSSPWIPARLIAAAAASFALVVGCGKFNPTRDFPHGPPAVGGTLDLRDWDFSKRGSVTLYGEWEFFSGVLLTETRADAAGSWTVRNVPDIWRGNDAGGPNGTGAGTYRLRVILPRNHPDLSIRNETVATSFEIEADGVTVSSGGKPDETAALAVPGYSPSVSALHPRSDILDLIVRVSNHEYRAGGIWHAFVIGISGTLEAGKRLSVYGSLLIFAAIAALSLNSLCVFLFRKKELPFLFFAVFVGPRDAQAYLVL
jgi:two-component system, sensor histidine kinase ChiS